MHDRKDHDVPVGDLVDDIERKLAADISAVGRVEEGGNIRALPQEIENAGNLSIKT